MGWIREWSFVTASEAVTEPSVWRRSARLLVAGLSTIEPELSEDSVMKLIRSLMIVSAFALFLLAQSLSATTCMMPSVRSTPACSLLLSSFPGEGQGVLISPEWVVTAGQAVTWRPIHEVTISGIPRPVAEVIVHPGYKTAPNPSTGSPSGTGKTGRVAKLESWTGADE
jgi:hypothetical protein